MIDANALAQGAATGAMPSDQVAELQKSLEAGYGTDMASLTGAAAMRIQSLDTTMQATIQDNKHFKLFNRLPKPKAGATVDEWTEQSAVGGFLGGTSNSELGVIADSNGTYNRRVGLTKYLMTRRQVSVVATLQNSLADVQAIEYSNGAKQLLSDAEFLLFEGNSAVVPTEFDGIYAQIAAGIAAGQVSSEHILDARGASLSSINLVNNAAAQISAFGNFGSATDLYYPNQVQADFDNSLDPAFRVALDNTPNSVMLGTPVTGIRTSQGNIATNTDVFIRDERMQTPFESRYAAIATANAGMKPTLGVPSVAPNAASLFTGPQAGNYYYLVTGVNAAGQSTGVISSQVAAVAGSANTLVITRSGGAAETGYVIYRSKQNGTNTVADFREMAKIACAGATTTYVDLNADLPGTCKAYMLNLSAGDTAITWRQLLPMIKFPLYATNAAVIPWAQLMFGYLRISKRNHHVVIKNIVPTGALWKPFV